MVRLSALRTGHIYPQKIFLVPISVFQMVSLEFFFDVIRPHYGPGVDSASNRKEYQDYFLVVKAAGV
jgi:hypothetical protein